MDKALERIKELDREIRTLNGIEALLGWDHHVYMPERGVHQRSEQTAYIASLSHQKVTNPEFGDLLDKLGASAENPLGSKSLSDDDRRLVRAVYRDFHQQTRVPGSLVEEFARVTSIAQSVWTEARKKSDFSLFRPHLEKIVDLNLQLADHLGYTAHPYDALVDQYEPEITTAQIATVFRQLREALVPLVRDIKAAKQVDTSFLRQPYPVELQEQFGRAVLDAIGFDSQRARLDRSVHPFTTTIGVDDVRITTRYLADLVTSSLFGIVHEAGHAFYELGFAEGFRGTRLADACSLGIHESMSRFWENVIGRGRAFWSHFYPQFKETFPDQLSGVDIEAFYKAINRVEPSLIRVEADEVTYSLHIILRFELERMLIGKELKVKDLPHAWHEQSRDLLGIVPDGDASGVLQDIHWSGGSIGYFPTYALGNVYGLQFTAKLREQIPDLDTKVRHGEFAPIKAWLDTNVHAHGRSRTPQELCQQITGNPMSAEPFVNYLKTKYRDIYDL
ncbi:MAG: carboxypeptidase M32 [Spirochaetaceae bacterium]|nr:MAG: carboxypeptidase M32 [Spirochaetaceae bacterium]